MDIERKKIDPRATKTFVNPRFTSKNVAFSQNDEKKLSSFFGNPVENVPKKTSQSQIKIQPSTKVMGVPNRSTIETVIVDRNEEEQVEPETIIKKENTPSIKIMRPNIESSKPLSRNIVLSQADDKKLSSFFGKPAEEISTETPSDKKDAFKRPDIKAAGTGARIRSMKNKGSRNIPQIKGSNIKTGDKRFQIKQVTPSRMNTQSMMRYDHRPARNEDTPKIPELEKVEKKQSGITIKPIAKRRNDRVNTCITRMSDKKLTSEELKDKKDKMCYIMQEI